MSFKVTLVALILLGTVAPAMAQNLNDNELREIRQYSLKAQREARRESVKQSQRTRRALIAGRGNIGLATSPRFRHASPDFH